MQAKNLVGGAAVLALGASLIPAGPALAAEQPGVVRFSVSIEGRQSNGGSSRPVISGDGRFAVFQSAASNLIPDDYNSATDVFFKDLVTGEVSRIGTGMLPSMSSDARYIAFLSGSSVFVHDRQLGVTTLASVATDGTPSNASIQDVGISAEGRHVVFSTTATTLAPGATGTNRKVFVRDLEAGTTAEVSVRPDGVSGRNDSLAPTISGDGRFVAFASTAKELVPGGRSQHVKALYVRDLHTGVTRRLNSGFVKGYPTISADGRYVGYAEASGAVFPGDTNGVTDILRHDLVTGDLTRVTVAPDGSAADKDSHYLPQHVPMSADGRYVMFESAATNLVEGDTNEGRDVFVRDMESGTTSRLSPDSADAKTTAANYVGGLNSDGGAAVFFAERALTAEDTNQLSDVYLWRRG